MPHGVEESVEEVEEHGANELLTTIGPVDKVVRLVLLGSGNLTGDLLVLPGEATTPNGHGQNEEDDEGDLGAETATDALVVEGVADNESADDLGEPVEETVEGTGADVEHGAVETVVLVGVEDVGGEEHREEEDDPGVLEEGLPETDELGLPGGVLHENDLGAVLTDDLVGVDEENTEDETDEHENDEGGVGTVSDGTGSPVDVLSEGDLAYCQHSNQNYPKIQKTHQRANDGTRVEDDPEPRDVAALHVLSGVRHHDRTLSRPQQTSADTQESTSKDSELKALNVVVSQETRGVERVSNTAKGDGQAQTEHVGNGAREETDDGENTVQGRVGVHLGLLVDLTSTAQTTQGIEHTRAHEADEGDHKQLDGGRGVPDLLAADAEALVDPSIGAVDKLGGRVGVALASDLGGRRLVLLFGGWGRHCDVSLRGDRSQIWRRGGNWDWKSSRRKGKMGERMDGYLNLACRSLFLGPCRGVGVWRGDTTA